jgi:hypothetical protein
MEWQIKNKINKDNFTTNDSMKGPCHINLQAWKYFIRSLRNNVRTTKFVICLKHVSKLILRVQMMVYDTQNQWVSGFGPAYRIFKELHI